MKAIAMMISGECLAELKENVDFKLTDKGFTFLGVIIAPNFLQ